MKKEIVNWIKGSPELNAKELKWQLLDMGVSADESEIAEVVMQRMREKCRCPDRSGSCAACLEHYALS